MSQLDRDVPPEERIQYALYDAHDENREVAVLLMDLDRFKEINDTLGHHHGDLLLQELGARLKTALRESDTVARLGGDEFGILLPSIPDRRVVNEVVERIRTAVEEPFNLQGLPLAIETSIGVFMPVGELKALRSRVSISVVGRSIGSDVGSCGAATWFELGR